jgi:hypothetical protein
MIERFDQPAKFRERVAESIFGRATILGEFLDRPLHRD